MLSLRGRCAYVLTAADEEIEADIDKGRWKYEERDQRYACADTEDVALEITTLKAQGIQKCTERLPR